MSESVSGTPVSTGAVDASTQPQTTEQAETGVEQNEAKAAAQSKPKPEPRKYKVKIGDLEEEVPDTELVAGYQLRKASAQKFEEAAKIRKEVETILTKAKSDPWALIEYLGGNPDEMAEQRLINRLQQEKLTPEQRELLQRQQELEQREARIREYEEQTRNQTVSKLQQEQTQRMSTEIIAALESIEFPANEDFIAEMARIKAEALANDYDMPWVDAARAVEEHMAEIAERRFRSMPTKKLMKMLGEETMKRIRAEDVAALRTQQPKQHTQPPAPKPQAKKGPMTMDEWKALVAKR